MTSITLGRFLSSLHGIVWICNLKCDGADYVSSVLFYILWIAEWEQSMLQSHLVVLPWRQHSSSLQGNTLKWLCSSLPPFSSHPSSLCPPWPLLISVHGFDLTVYHWIIIFQHCDVLLQYITLLHPLLITLLMLFECFSKLLNLLAFAAILAIVGHFCCFQFQC